MMPKIRVSPEATRNSNNPYCSALRHWIRKVVKSIEKALFTLPLRAQQQGAG